MRLFIILFSALYISYASASCPAVAWQETVTLKKINDGDTVTLSDGRLVRFIGINTPEINHRELHKSEPFAIDAKLLLEKYLNEGDKLHLVFDKQRQDKYGRLLAYVYSKTGRNMALLQLQAGLAEQWVVAGNDRFWQCFQQAERQARLAKKGIWSNFVPLSAASLKKRDKGYVYVTGEITSISDDSKNIVLTLEQRLMVKIKRDRQPLFGDSQSAFMRQQSLLLRGKLIFSQDKAYLNLYHPVQILH